jgi:REP element-mobilizing transposase RayT
MNRGRRGELIFRQKEDYLCFIDLLKETAEMWNLRVSAYCLMSSHYHLLVQTPNANLSRCMRHLGGVYTQRFNSTHLIDGQLFRGRYKSILIEKQSYLLELVRYIHRNPLEAGVVDRLDKYPWSSYKGYLSGAKKWDWLHKGFVLSLFSNAKADSLTDYKVFISKETPERINQILDKRNLPSVLGTQGFIERIKGEFFDKKRHKEIPESKFLAPDADRIKEEVCKAFDVDRAELYESRRGLSNQPRNVAIYLLRTLRGDTLGEISREFNMNRYSSVSSVVQRMSANISKDRQLRKCVEKLKAKVYLSQE